MHTKRHFISTLLLTCLCFPVFADNHLTETRYCGEPERDARGRIKRSQAVIEAFERRHPLPAGENRKDYAINHVIPLASGGCDAVRNMDWMRITGKSCAEDYCKDRYERIIYPELH
jgi:hypothetical protein